MCGSVDLDFPSEASAFTPALPWCLFFSSFNFLCNVLYINVYPIAIFFRLIIV